MKSKFLSTQNKMWHYLLPAVSLCPTLSTQTQGPVSRHIIRAGVGVSIARYLGHKRRGSTDPRDHISTPGNECLLRFCSLSTSLASPRSSLYTSPFFFFNQSLTYAVALAGTQCSPSFPYQLSFIYFIFGLTVDFLRNIPCLPGWCKFTHFICHHIGALGSLLF